MNQSSMPKVQLGISLVFWGLELMALAILLTLVIPFVIPFMAAKMLPFLMIVIPGLGIMLLIAGLMSMVGKILCLAAPREMEGKGVIYACVAFELAFLLIGLAEKVTIVPAILSGLKGFFPIIGFVLFLIFLRKLAEFIQNRELAEKAGGLLKLGVALVVFVILAFVLAFRFPIGTPIVMLITVITGIIGLVRYSRLLLAIKNVLKTV